MNRSTDRQGAFTRARVVSLALIALAVLGLAYLRFADSDWVSVPRGLDVDAQPAQLDDRRSAPASGVGESGPGQLASWVSRAHAFTVGAIAIDHLIGTELR
jgi:hypothetical protein